MAENPTPQPAKPAAKPRNPVERVIVWGFIAVMLVVVAVEGNSWWQHKQALADLIAKTSAVDKAPDAQAITEADIKAYFQGKQPSHSSPPEAGNNFTGASRIDVYSWFTISPVNKREIYVYYGRATKDDKGGPEVLAIQVKDEAPPPQVASGEAPPAQGGPPQGMMMPGMQGGPGGGPGGRPAAGHDASTAGGEKASDDKAEGEKPADDKSGDDTSDEEKTEKDQQ
jgi:hypothetical protein